MNTTRRIICWSIMLAILALGTGFSTRFAYAADIATIRAVTGPVDILKGGKLPSIRAMNGATLASGDFIRTKSGGYAEIAYLDGTVLKVSPRSRIDIGEHFSGGHPDSSQVRLTRGKIQALVDLKKVTTQSGSRRFEVRTPNAIAGVRGTDFVVSHERSTTGVYVRSGGVYSYNLTNPERIVDLTPGMLTTIRGNTPPTPPRPALGNEIRRMEQNFTPATGGSASEANSITGQSAVSGAPLTGNAGISDTPTAAYRTDSGIAPELYSGRDPLANQALAGGTIMPTLSESIIKRPNSSASPVLSPAATVYIPPTPPPTATNVNVKVKVNF